MKFDPRLVPSNGALQSTRAARRRVAGLIPLGVTPAKGRDEAERRVGARQVQDPLAGALDETVPSPSAVADASPRG
jgi:hypothetical protein